MIHHEHEQTKQHAQGHVDDIDILLRAKSSATEGIMHQK
jgi:hypothetical protein